MGALPPQLAALNRTFLNVCELTVRAALEGSREHVYHAALLDPNAAATLSPERICAMVDDLIEAHGEALPDGIAPADQNCGEAGRLPPPARPSPLAAGRPGRVEQVERTSGWR